MGIQRQVRPDTRKKALIVVVLAVLAASSFLGCNTASTISSGYANAESGSMTASTSDSESAAAIESGSESALKFSSESEPSGIDDGIYVSDFLHDLTTPYQGKASVTVARLEGEYFRCYGKMKFSSQGYPSDDASTVVGPQEWSIKLASNVEYSLHGAINGPQSTTREEIERILDAADRMGLSVQVVGGEVVALGIHS